MVCNDKTGHAEVIELEFDPSSVSYKELLDVFWGMHDPTQVDRQGPDYGSQYRSVIFYHTEKQKEFAQKSRETLERSKKYTNKIVTQILPIEHFYKAEDYHQQYLEKRGLPVCHF